jgi:hypothetical protein
VSDIANFHRFSTPSVVCAIGPSVNTFFIFHILRIENLKIQQSEHIEGQCFFFGLIFATWRPKNKWLANPTKGFLRFKKQIAIS